MKLSARRESWANFFEVMSQRKHPIERVDGQSTGNFWATVHNLESQFRMYKPKPKMPLIILEGIDMSGKDTQLNLLKQYLSVLNKDFEIIAEVRDDEYGQLLRRKLADPRISYIEDCLLFALNRYKTVRLISEAFHNDKFVIMNRYIDSTFAYQMAQGAEFDWLYEINQFYIVPTVVIILDIDPNVSLLRSARKKDKYEKVAYLEKVRANYLKLNRLTEHKYEIVDASLPEAEVFEQVKKIVLKYI